MTFSRLKRSMSESKKPQNLTRLTSASERKQDKRTSSASTIEKTKRPTNSICSNKIKPSSRSRSIIANDEALNESTPESNSSCAKSKSKTAGKGLNLCQYNCCGADNSESFSEKFNPDSLPRTRSGRIVIPRLEYWHNQYCSYRGGKPVLVAGCPGNSIEIPLPDIVTSCQTFKVPHASKKVENPSLGKKRKGNLVPNQRDSRTLHASTASTITASYYTDKKRRVLQPIEVQLPMADNSDPSSNRHLSNFGDKTILIVDDMDMTYKDCTITKSYIHDITVETDSLALNRTCYNQDAMEFTHIEPKTMRATLHEIVGSQFGDKTVMFSGDYEGDMSVTCFEKRFVAPNNDLEQSVEEYSDNSESGVGEKYAHEVLKIFLCNPINTIPDSSVSSRFGLELVDKSTLVHPNSSKIFRKKFISPDLSDGMECDRTLTKLCPVSYQDKETMLKEMAQVESSFRDICGSMCNSNGKSDKKDTQSSSIASMSTMTTATNLASASYSFPNPVASRSEYVKSKPLSGEETMKNAVEKSLFSVDMEPTECVSRNIILVNEEEAPISSCKKMVMQTNSARCTIEDMEETRCATEGINFPLTCRSKTWNSNAKGITIIFDSENADVDSTSVVDGTIMVALPESTISNEAEWDSSSGKGIQQSKVRTNVDHNSEVVHSVLPLDSTNQTPNESLIGEATSNLLKEAELALTLLDKNNKSLEKDFQPTTLSSELNSISADVSSNVLLSNLNNKKMDVKLLPLSHDEKNEVTELSQQTEPKTTIFPAALNCPKEMISHSLSYSTKNYNSCPEAYLNDSRVDQLCPVGVPVPNSEIIQIDEQLTKNTDAFSRKRSLVQSMSDSNHGTLLKSKTCDDRKCKEQKLDEAVTRSDVSHAEVLEANTVKGNIVNMSSCGSTLQGVIMTTQDHSTCDIISQECSKQSGSFVSIPCNANEEVVSVAEVNSCTNKLLKNENLDLRVHDTSVKIHLNEDRNNASVNREQGFLNTKAYENEPTKEAPNCENGSVLHEKSVSDLAEFLSDNRSFNLLNQSSVKPLDKISKIPLEKTACKTNSNQALTSKVATEQLKVNTCQNLTFGSCRELYSDIERCNRRQETTNLSTSVLALNDPLASDITVASAVMSAEIFQNYRPAANEGKSNEVVCPATVDVVNEAHDLSTEGGKPEVDFDRQHLTASVQQSTESQQLVVQQTDLAHHSNNSKSTRFKENASNKNHDPHEINLLASSIDHIPSSTSSQDVESNAANCIEMKHIVQKITQYGNSNIGLTNSRKQNLAEKMPALHVEYAEAMCLEENAVKKTTNYETVDDIQKLNATTITMEQLRGEKTSNGKSERNLPKDVAVLSKEIDSANSMARKLNHSTSFVQQSDVTIVDFQLIRKDQSSLSSCETFANDISRLSPVDDLLDQYIIPLRVQDNVSLLHDPEKISSPPMSILSESRLEVAAVATDKSREGGWLESLNKSKFYDDDIERPSIRLSDKSSDSASENVPPSKAGSQKKPANPKPTKLLRMREVVEDEEEEEEPSFDDSHDDPDWPKTPVHTRPRHRTKTGVKKKPANPKPRKLLRMREVIEDEEEEEEPSFDDSHDDPDWPKTPVHTRPRHRTKTGVKKKPANPKPRFTKAKISKVVEDEEEEEEPSFDDSHDDPDWHKTPVHTRRRHRTKTGVKKKPTNPKPRFTKAKISKVVEDEEEEEEEEPSFDDSHDDPDWHKTPVRTRPRHRTKTGVKKKPANPKPRFTKAKISKVVEDEEEEEEPSFDDSHDDPDWHKTPVHTRPRHRTKTGVKKKPANPKPRFTKAKISKVVEDEEEEEEPSFDDSHDDPDWHKTPVHTRPRHRTKTGVKLWLHN